MLRVVIADDHPVVLKGLKDIIRESFLNATVDETSKGYELMQKVQNNDYDLVLLDISLPDIHGLEVLKEIKRKKPRLPILIISMYPEEDYAVRAIRAGARGYVTKRTASDELVEAVRKILSGKRYINPDFAQQMLFDFECDAGTPAHQELSTRELQVIARIGAGKATKQIAEELHVSANTVRTYRTRILEKTGLKGTSELIHYALIHGLTE